MCGDRLQLNAKDESIIRSVVMCRWCLGYYKFTLLLSLLCRCNYGQSHCNWPRCGILSQCYLFPEEYCRINRYQQTCRLDWSSPDRHAYLNGTNTINPLCGRHMNTIRRRMTLNFNNSPSSLNVDSC